MRKYRLNKRTMKHADGKRSYEYHFQKRILLIFWDEIGFNSCWQDENDEKPRFRVTYQNDLVSPQDRDVVLSTYMENYVRYYANVRCDYGMVPVFYKSKEDMPTDTWRLRYLVVNKGNFEFCLKCDEFTTNYVTDDEPMTFDQAKKVLDEKLGGAVVGREEKNIYPKETLR